MIERKCTYPDCPSNDEHVWLKPEAKNFEVKHKTEANEDKDTSWICSVCARVCTIE